MNHGGARKGAGRPKGGGRYGEPTHPVRIPVSLVKSIMKYVKNKGFKLPLYGSKVAAGSPSPTDDHIENQLDLHEYLVKHPAETFLVRASGNSMIDAGIHDNDILIVDRNIKPTDGKIAIVSVDGQLTVKRLHIKNKTLFLIPENKDFEPIAIKEGSEIHIWGVVTNVIHSV